MSRWRGDDAADSSARPQRQSVQLHAGQSRRWHVWTEARWWSSEEKRLGSHQSSTLVTDPDAHSFHKTRKNGRALSQLSFLSMMHYMNIHSSVYNCVTTRASQSQAAVVRRWLLLQHKLMELRSPATPPASSSAWLARGCCLYVVQLRRENRASRRCVGLGSGGSVSTARTFEV